MAMGKRKEYEIMLAQRTAELEALSNKLTEQNRQLDEFRQREAAVVEALTKAQAVAKEITDTANEKLSQVNQNAEHIIQQAKEEADKILEAAMSRADEKLTEATGRAAQIVEDAQKEASRRLSQAEASSKSYHENIEMVNTELKQTAELARSRAEAFAKFIEHLIPVGNEEFVIEGQGLSSLLDAQPIETPQEYEGPAELMKSIYSIQGRDVQPAEDTSEKVLDTFEEPYSNEEEPESEEQVWSVDKVLSQTPVEQIEDNPLMQELESIIDGVFEEDEVDSPNF